MTDLKQHLSKCVTHILSNNTLNSNIDGLTFKKDQENKVVFFITKPLKLLLDNLSFDEIHFVVEKDVKLQVNFLSLEQPSNGNYTFDLEENATVYAFLVDTSCGTANMQVTFNLNKPFSYAEWQMASLGADKDRKVFDINIKHSARNTTGLMSNYGVCEDEAHMHFKGVSHIFNSCIQSKTHQSAKIMVFDEMCHAKANPILKIDENDIEASHAAVVGKINEEHMFYLCSRGIKQNEAKQLITMGYLKPITKYFDGDELVETIIKSIEKRL